MLEGLVAWILNTYVGEYFENLNTDQLSVGLLHGEVDLENLPLKKDSWNCQNYPIEIKAGCCGKVKLQIPVYRLRSEPWVISVEKLFVVFGPATPVGLEKEQELQLLHQKLNHLQDHEAAWRAAHNGNESNYSYWKSCSTSVFANIIENVQLNVQDVHIRYEDDTSCGNSQFACGAVIRSLAAQSTDKNWMPSFNRSESSEISWKLIELKGLSFYWDTNAKMVGSSDIHQMMDDMMQHIDLCILPDGVTKKHDYILSTFDATARLKRNCSNQALKTTQTPRIVCDIHLQKVPLYFSQAQYNQLLQWEKAFHYLCLKWNNRKLRPQAPISSCPKKWWEYAILSHLAPVWKKNRSKTRSFIQQRVKDINKYANAYYCYLKNSDLPVEVKDVKDALELKLELDELLILQRAVMDKIKREKSAMSANSKQLYGHEFLQWLFPNWMGWYSTENYVTTESVTENIFSEDNGALNLEKEILGVLNDAADETLLKSDVIFAQLNFSVSHGTFVLIKNEYVSPLMYAESEMSNQFPIIELDFSDIIAKFETRPRMKSVLFEVRLGCLYLHDKMFSTSNFAEIIAPQNRDICFTSDSGNSTLFQSENPTFGDENDVGSTNRYLFELLYEKNPWNIRADYKLTVRTKPLDVVINLELMRVLADFFSTRSCRFMDDDYSLLSLASERYENFKEHTKEELQQTWNRIFVGGEQAKSSKWCIEFEIAAPQIIIPENVFDANANVVIIDFGDLHVFNSTKQRKLQFTSEDSDNLEDDDFHTPCSTPEEFNKQPSFVVDGSDSSLQVNNALLGEMYDSYVVELRNIQVLVSSLKDSWKFAQLRGSSSLHVLNRFSISIEAHRRKVLSCISEWPHLAVFACLPKLNTHFSENKVMTLRTCFDALNSYFCTPGKRTENQSSSIPVIRTAVTGSFSAFNSERLHKGFHNIDADAADSCSFLLLVQFKVDQIFFDLQDKNHSIAEVQVSGLQTSYSMHCAEALLMLTIHSLLVVDASQTYGPDFELLIASHKNVSIDSCSGALENVARTEASGQAFFAIGDNFSKWPSFAKLPAEETFRDALIYFTLKVSQPDEALPEQLYNASMKFNNLDVIANQDTIFELVHIFNQLATGISRRHCETEDLDICEFSDAEAKSYKEKPLVPNRQYSKIEATFKFHRLSVLMLRSADQDTKREKLATTTLCDLQVKAKIGSSIELQGTVGAFQLMNLLTKETRYQKILNLCNETFAQTSSLPATHFGISDDTSVSDEHAFSFKVVKSDSRNTRSASNELAEGSHDAEFVSEYRVTAKMASFVYVHSPDFLAELSCCASEFQRYLKSFGDSIKSAATGVAKGMVSVGLYNAEGSASSCKQDYFSKEIGCGDAADMHWIEECTALNIRCSIFFKSPVLVLPILTSGTEVFLAHLGHIAVCSKPKSELKNLSSGDCAENFCDSICVEISGMNVFYASMDSKTSLAPTSQNGAADKLKIEICGSMYSCSPVLDDTAFEFHIYPFPELFYQDCIPLSENQDFYHDRNFEMNQKEVFVKGCVRGPVKVRLNKYHYEQLLNLVNNLLSNHSDSSSEFSSSLFRESNLPSHVDKLNSNQQSSEKTVVHDCLSSKSYSTSIHVEFCMPDLTVELSENMSGKGSLLHVEFKEFSFEYDKKALHETSVKVSLAEVLMKDYQGHGEVECCSILLSSDVRQQTSKYENISCYCFSQSCPDISASLSEIYPGSQSFVPGNLITRNSSSQKSDYQSNEGNSYGTWNISKAPHHCSSCKYSNSHSTHKPLVELSVLITKDLSSAQANKKVHTLIQIDFNALCIIIDLNSWMAVQNFFARDFFTNEEQIYSQGPLVSEGNESIDAADCSVEFNNTELEMHVRYLEIVLKKPEYELACMSISDFDSWMFQRENCFRLEGKLGCILLQDLTLFGQTYPERLVTTASDAVRFMISGFKEDSSIPSFHKNYRIHVKSQIASAIYVHTQRFLVEITEFFQSFQDRRNVISRKLESSEQIEEWQHHTLLSLHVNSPSLVIPTSSFSKDVFVITLKCLTADNKMSFQKAFYAEKVFPSDEENLCDSKYQGEKARNETAGTGANESKNRENKDVIDVKFIDFNLYTGTHCLQDNSSEIAGTEDTPTDFSLSFPSYKISTKRCLLQQKFAMEIQVEKTVGLVSVPEAPDVSVWGLLSSVDVVLDLEEYKLVRAALSNNFGEALEEGIFDPCKEVGQFVLMDAHSGASPKVVAHIKVTNVSLMLISECKPNSHEKHPLARFDFLMSQFSYISFSDNSRDLDLVFNEIHVMDVRYKDYPANNRPNVFTNMLLPKKNGTAKSVLQAELHYRTTHELARLTVLLNNVRVMGILDFLKSTYNFFTCPVIADEPPENLKPLHLLVEPMVKQSLEVKLNISNTEFVIVEDPSNFESSAALIKATAVISWRPEHNERPLSCSLQQLELLSCVIGMEETTSITLMEPVNIGVDLIAKQSSSAEFKKGDILCSLEGCVTTLNLQISYCDVLRLSKIYDSLMLQFGLQNTEGQVSPSEEDLDVRSLCALGFSSMDCRKALITCQGNLDDAAIWLTQNATATEGHALPVNQQLQSDVQNRHWSGMKLSSLEIRIDAVHVTIIEEFQDAGVPVLELSLSEGTISANNVGSEEGHAEVTLSMDYYNCASSGWEPLIEPWKCNLIWKSSTLLSGASYKVLLQVSSDNVLNFNVTSSFLELYKLIELHWSKDSTISSYEKSYYRRKSQLIPFALKNDTGCKLWFASQVVTSNKFSGMGELYRDLNKCDGQVVMSWKEVESGETTQITFRNSLKKQRMDYHHLMLHQIIVRLENWKTFAPVSLDKVGVYFRHAQSSHYSSICRIVLRVKLENGAQKCVTVQSAVSLTNKLDDVLEVMLQSPGMFHGVREHRMLLAPSQTISVPLPFVYGKIWARPSSRDVSFSNLPVCWEHVTGLNEIKGYLHVCNSTGASRNSYKFCACVMNESFPEIYEFSERRELSSSLKYSPLPGHRLVFMPCFEIVNLLPYELRFNIEDFGLGGCIKPGKKQQLCEVDISKNFSFASSIENFKQLNKVVVSLTARHCPSHIALSDSLGRVLHLQLKVLTVVSNAVKLFVSAPYWLVNKTGLPLVFKQEGAQAEAAGQFYEHEMARSMSPLMFSFADQDASAMCTMRIGKSLHPDCHPTWCSHFRLEKGVRFRQLHVSRSDSRPDWVYNIGIEITSGKGIYKDTNIVILSPRYQLDNRSKHVLEFCQKFAIKENRQYALSAIPECSLPFHWPRIDLDNLLCVRMADVPNCCWSGGFTIDNVQSFHINMRDADRISHFLQTGVVLHGATYYVIFTESECFPPPIRVDNYSEVPVTYYQTNVTEEKLKTTVRPHASVPYAWDEPMLPPYITCCAPGGSSATYNTNIFHEGSQLFYENFIYIAFTGTFWKNQFKILVKSELPSEIVQNLADQELVLDVPTGTKVVLSKKETGKRTQLWRMTSSGMLQHEGSSPPCDLQKLQSVITSPQRLVLDIAALCPQPEESTCLMLRKPDIRRHHTQTWKFTSDGRLCCGYPNMCIQSDGGYPGLVPGNLAVLAPSSKYSPVNTNSDVPVEQAVCRKKLRGGSGVLCVNVVPDGPTRVLKITDLKQKSTLPQASSPNKFDEIDMSRPPEPPGAAECVNVEKIGNSKFSHFQIFLRLVQGLGITVVNHLNEDLVYMKMQDITVELNKSSTALLIDGSFRNLQVDNQLREAENKVLLFATPLSKYDDQQQFPDVHLTVHHISTTLRNAEIFKHVILTIKNLTVHLEEYLLMKLLQFLQLYQAESESQKLKEDYSEIHSSLFQHMAESRRYYFSTLKLSLQQVRLSVQTTDNLPPDLQHIKNKSGLHLIRFEDATIELDPYLRVHPFETAHFLTESIMNHYKEELRSQAAKIFGAVDFLGNPLGLVNDVTDGISEFIHDGNFGGLIKNVAHGLSDSAAKLSKTLSDGLGFVAIDEKHQKMRKQIHQGRNSDGSDGNDHLVAGLQGLGIGLLGGVTSLFTQTYEGISQEGIQGFLSGFGRGLVGTVAKPAVGFLDLASGAASAVRDTSKRNFHATKPRLRPPRFYVGPGCLLPPYSLQQAVDQELLYKLNNKDYTELFIAKEVLHSEFEEVKVLVSTKQVHFLSCLSSASNSVILTIPLDDLIHCNYICRAWETLEGIQHFLQLHVKDGSYSGKKIFNCPSIKSYFFRDGDEQFCKKLLFRCDNVEVVEQMVMQINYAKFLHEESKYMLPVHTNRDIANLDS